MDRKQQSSQLKKYQQNPHLLTWQHNLHHVHIASIYPNARSTSIPTTLTETVSILNTTTTIAVVTTIVTTTIAIIILFQTKSSSPRILPPPSQPHSILLRKVPPIPRSSFVMHIALLPTHVIAVDWYSSFL
mmetsp:Transcript_17418/g.31505  ORF Transcript_17418/g.31505 Transcript_17418/m.31505 type:complete len:131 (-) Transcript_17418:200-592(-)